jgi:hypothetical protein
LKDFYTPAKVKPFESPGKAGGLLILIIRYAGLYSYYIKGDPFIQLLMNEVEESDTLEFISRLARMNMKGRDYKTKKLAGTETFEEIVKLFRMAFQEYQKSHPKWHNAFRGIDPPKHTQQVPGMLLPRMRW